MTADIIFQSFPDLTEVQRARYNRLDELYRYWNERINVISRKDIDNLYLHHVLHSLGIAKVVSFAAGARVLDVGTGGGFPGIPLAIMYPEVKFRLIDRTAKKIRVVQAVAEALELDNVSAQQLDAAEERGPFDYVVSRAVTDAAKLLPLVKGKVRHGGPAGSAAGLYCLKGGDLTDELQGVGRGSKSWNLKDYFADPFFETKKVVFLPI